MGLGVELFDSQVPMDLICVMCKKVLVNPVQNACQHLFCGTCLVQHLKADKSRTCPACNAHLRVKSEPPSLEVRLRLLDLNIHCSQRCGKVLKVGELPDHVSEECPYTPVACPHARLGCRMEVQRLEVGEHAEECDWRPVVCEACGHRTVRRDLCTHQSRKRCLEKKLRHQVSRAMRATNADVMQHRYSLQRQHSSMGLQQRCSQREDLSATSKIALGLRAPSGSGHPSRPPGSETPSVVGGLHTPAPSRASTHVLTCQKCKRPYRVDLNSPTACRWHAGVRFITWSSVEEMHARTRDRLSTMCVCETERDLQALNGNDLK